MKHLRQLQVQLTVHGFVSDTLTLASLIAFCSLSHAGDIHHARRLFDSVIYPNRFMYNTLIRGYSNSSMTMESLALLRRMMVQGCSPNNFTFPFVLKSIAVDKAAFLEALLVHSLIIKTGFVSQDVVMNALLHVYVACDQVSNAHKVFDEIPQKTIVSWNSIIDGYSQMGDFRSAVVLVGIMRGLDLELDEFTLASLLSVCAHSGNLKWGRILHHYVVMNGIEKDLIVANALLDMYGKCREPALAQMCFDRMPARNVVSWTSLVCVYANNEMLSLARCWFDQMQERSIVSWNAMIDCYVHHDQCHEALNLYESMQASGIVPNEATLVNVLSACSQTGNLVIGKRMHDYIVHNMTNPSLSLLNSIIAMYAKCGYLDVAFSIFDMINKKNVVSWNVMIAASAAHGNALEAVELFRSMSGQGFLPDSITFVGLLSACSHGGLLEFGQHYFEAMDPVYNVAHEIEHYACMVDLFGRRGYVSRAIEFIRSMPMKPDVVIWCALLGACRMLGNAKIAVQVMKQVLVLEPYSSGIYVLMSNLFCETQRWEDARNLRKMMRARGMRKVEGRSLIELGGKIHEFLIEDVRHESSFNIYMLMDQLTDHLTLLHIEE